MFSSCTNWDALPTAKMVGDINGGAGAGAMYDGAQVWKDFAGVLRDTDVTARAALQSATAGYTGQGSEAMTKSISPFRDWADAADTMFATAGQAAMDSGAAFSSARNAMPGPGQVIDPTAVEDSAWDKARAFLTFSQTDGEKAEAAAADQHQQAVQAMGGYETKSYDYTTPFAWPMPPLMTASAAPPAPAGTVSVGSATGPWSPPAPTRSTGSSGGATTSAWAAQSPVHSTTGGPHTPLFAVTPQVPGEQSTPPTTSYPGYQAPAGTTGQSTGYSPTGPGTAGYGPSGSSSGAQGSGAAGSGAGGYGAAGVPGFGGVGGGARDTASARRGYGPGMSFGSGSGGAGGGSSSGGSGGWNEGAGAGGPTGAGGSTGAGSAGGGATASAAGGTGSPGTGSNAAGGRGASGMGGAGGRGGQGAEDDEHETPDYLKHFEHFEDGRLIAPPVIGAD